MAAGRSATALGPAALLAALVALPGCAPEPFDADVIVIGAGIAGLSAALEAADRGADVIVVEANSVGGGHAVKAGGFALVGTPLQEKRGYEDDTETAVADLLAWGVDADPEWVRAYVEDSRTEVHDWLGRFGVRFTFILDTPEHSVPRFHFAGGGAVNVVLPLLGVALSRPAIEFAWNAEATELLTERGAVAGVEILNPRTRVRRRLRAPAVIIATGGFQANLDMVRRFWREDIPLPGQLYVGAGYFAAGSGIALGEEVGAAVARMDHQTTFTSGVPDPRDASGERALLVQNASAIMVDAAGNRFIDETSPSKVTDDTILAMAPATHWLVFDSGSASSLRVRDAVWLDTGGGARLLDDPAMVSKADSIETLAKETGLPADALVATVNRYNAMLEQGVDDDFGRLGSDEPDRFARPVRQPPFYAIQLFPMTRKSMGGLAVDGATRVLDGEGRPIPGLFAAGEVTGVAGINGSYGGEGTFLGPAVYMGRLAGHAAAGSTAAGTAADRAVGVTVPAPGPEARVELKPATPSDDPAWRDRAVTMSAVALGRLVAQERPGYWHFEVAHRVVAERDLDCAACHTPDWPTGPATTVAGRQVQLRSCRQCH